MAQRNVATFKATKNTRFAANTSGAISAADSSDMYEDVADSFLNITDHLLDEDDMASDSATKVPSQQSVKAYVDSQVSNVSSVEVYAGVKEDFITSPVGTVSLSTFNNGGGLGVAAAPSTFGIDSTEKACGVLAFSTGTSTAGGSALTNITYTFTFGFGFIHTISFRTALSALSDGTDTYTIRLGFLDSHSGSPTDGAYFRYTHGTNSGKWQAVTVSNSTETAEDTTIAAEASVFHVFKIVTNSDATQVDFYIDGVKTNDITTNIINDAARLTGQVATIEKTAGATARLMYLDYYEIVTERSTAR